MSRGQRDLSVDTQASRGNRILFTGPDAVEDYRPRRSESPCYVGSGTPSQEATGGLGYLTRAPPSPPAGVQGSRPRPQVGSVGWGWRYSHSLNRTTLLSNMQIKNPFD